MTKNNLLSRILKTDQLLTFAFGLVVYLFFSLGYAYHLHYQEQFQLFLFTTDYLAQYVGYPGGISDYLGNFITQFYFYSSIGAILLAIMLTLLQRMVWSVAQKLGTATYWIPLSFVPPVLYWSLLCDESYLAGGLVAILSVSAFIRTYLAVKNPRNRIIFTLLSVPALYWLAGGAFLLLPLFVLTREMMSKMMKPLAFSIFSAFLIGLSIVLPYLTKQFLVQFPFTKLLIGATYYRYPVVIPYSVAIVGLLIVFLPFLSKLLSSKLQPQRPAFWLAVQLLFLVSGSYFLLSKTADLNKEEVMEYDFHARTRRWGRILEKADRQAPTSPLSVTCLNLALAKQDLLGERMFHYYQNGIGGLLPDFTRDFTIPTILGEVYYHLGFINTAQRLAFEAMEALPDYQKSARSVMRLAETNLINGNYELAGKYLRLLQKTFYYRKWATNTLQATKKETLIEEHPEWGLLRKMRTQEDFLFSEGEKEMMLGTVFMQNQENKMAFEYLMACCLLKKDLQHFMEYYPVEKALNYRVVPKSYQEALIYVWGLSHNDPTQSIPYPISNSVKMRVKNYANIYTTRQNPEQLLRNDYSDTYWYYLHFRN
ncbi:DUF6057 family protein [Gaoshiqia sediminis]|uniref:DUF6057 family protein n=1 Tax=Gaoshiqia sediminis TaxID=2986998 RepID=A0AA41Y740_9BACT|nr:DUF6057 family protein [Gaoshiqia sediminis]MCW0483075.1 DUF6057 family protein [Gaoshiqia sediminis]